MIQIKILLKLQDKTIKGSYNLHLFNHLINLIFTDQRNIETDETFQVFRYA